jgi:HK97 family phage prohead protease
MKPKDVKKRMLELREELRVVRAAEGSDEPPKIVGHTAVFNQWSEDLGGFRERIRPGAFKKSIKRDDIRALWNHNTDYVLGRSKVSKTLTLAEDESGLAVEIVPPDTQFARDFMVSIERGDVSQMSFGFYTIKDEWTYPTDEEYNKGALADRDLIEVEMFDSSPCVFPAYPQTDVSIRSRLRAQPELPGDEPGDPESSRTTGTIDAILGKADAGEDLSDDEITQVHSAIEALQEIGGPPVSDNADPEEGGEASQSQDLTALKLALEIEQEL